MCSNSCECDPQASTNSQQDVSIKCRRCGSEPYILLDKVLAECKSCFLESCNKKLRSTIGKSKLLKNNDAILIAYSGGPSSSALLDLVRYSIESQARREQKFRPTVIHIDTQLNLPLNERLDGLKSVLDNAHKSNPDWHIFWSTLEMVTSIDESPDLLYAEFDGNFSDTSNLVNRQMERGKFLDATQGLDQTDRQKFYQDSIFNLIDRIANSINISRANRPQDQFKFTFTASSSTRLANDLLVDVILGLGSTIQSTVNICDRRYSVPIMRPMRDFSKKEVAFYVTARNLSYSTQTNIATLSDRKSSIQKTTEAFLSKLYVDYPATYNTLLRTGSKMQE